MVDDLAIPTVPEAKPDDPEDVSWALSTAEAMWARGDHSEGIKWVRRAAEAASEAEADERALELAKAAADLSAMVTRTSRVAQDELARGGGAARSAPPAQPTARSAPPAAPGAPSPPRVSSQAPPRPVGRPLTRPPPAMPSGKPLAARVEPTPRRGRRSKENLADAARAAGLLAPTREVAAAGDPTVKADRKSKSDATKRQRRRSRHDDASVDPKTDEQEAASAEDWDASPTASMSREELDSMDIEPVIAAPAPVPPPAAPPVRGPNPTLHDPELPTCQAIRVVIWQDANGVHIAPAGTRVTALTVEGLVVALQPDTDLTAWLSRRDRG